MTNPLTPREAEIAGLVAKGLPNKVIAAHLDISENTVAAHIQHAAMRLGGDSTPRHRLTVWFYSLDSDAA